MAVQGGLKAALRQSRRRLVAKRRRQILAGSLLFLVILLGAGALVQSLVRAPASPEVPRVVDATDTDQDGLADVVENTLGSDPLNSTPRHRLPEAWIQRHGLSIADPDLAEREAEYPRPPQSPPVYGPQGLPAEYRMTYHEVYSYGRPAGWDETTQGPWDNRLDPNRWDVNGSGVPYAWLIFHGLDPFDVASLDAPDPTRNVTWTPRDAYQRGIHPRSPDGDADGLPDEEEERLGLSPRRYSTAGTGIADGWMRAHGFPVAESAPAYQDTDRDGLTNLQEFQASLKLAGERALRGDGLDPRKQSTVDGPIPDGWLAKFGLDALDPNVHRKVTQEEAFTGPNGTYRLRLSVLQEYLVGRPPLWNESQNGPWMGGSDPTKDDTDADGLTDLQELVGWDTRRPTGFKHVVSDPTKPDTDADGLTDLQEREGKVGAITFASTDPGAPDSDFDGLLDGEELGIVPWAGLTLPTLDPNSEDTDSDGLRDGDEAAYWKGRHDAYVLEGRGYEWGPEPRPLPGVALSRVNMPPAAALAALLPTGDVDADGIPNILDPDSEADGLLDGWEANPALYQTSPYAAERARPTTDPANADTDQDGLPDRWEILYGLYDEKIGGWNLDPSQWSSFHDSTSDADRDLDADSTTWYAFNGRVPVPNAFRATNKVELQAGSDPNRFSSSPDGIGDGWKIFWGGVYPLLGPGELGDVYPGAPGELALPGDRPLPKVGATDTVVIRQQPFRHTFPVDGVVVRDSTCPQAPIEIQSIQGIVRACLLSYDITYDYKAAAANLTNPFLLDTDGDLMPDAWEAEWRRLGSGPSRLNPLADDAAADPDRDGLENLGEYGSGATGSSPYQPDSDFGGAKDDVEAALNLDPFDHRDDGRGLNANIDTDRDGIADVLEIAGVRDQRGVLVQTDPLHPDTDRDGLLDGRSLSTVLGRRLNANNAEDLALVRSYVELGLVVRNYPADEIDVVGETDVRTDPTLFSTAGDGVPDAYAVAFVTVTRGQPTGLAFQYNYGKPSWWNESLYGFWYSPLSPGQTPTRDMDQDGLDDLNGEDPIPAVNPTNRLPSGDPREPGLTARERLARAQAYDGDPLPGDFQRRTRVKVDLTLDPLPANVSAGGTTPFSGNLTRNATGEPASNVTVILALEDRSTIIGVAITDAKGQFRGNVTVAPGIPAPTGSAGVPVFGDLTGAGIHLNAGPALNAANTSRAVNVFAWTYNETWNLPLPSQDRGWLVDDRPAGGVLSAQTAPQKVNLTLTTGLAIEARATAPLGEPIWVNATLTDALGRPVGNENVTLLPGNVALLTDAKGRVSLNVTFPRVSGFHAVNATFNGTTFLLPSTKEIRVRFTESTRIEAFPPPSTLRPNESFLVSGTLRTAAGDAPVPGAPVVVDAGGARGTATTDRNGRYDVLLRLPADTPLGNVTLQAGFAGNDTLDPSSTTIPLRVEGAPIIEAEPVRVPVNTRTQVVARLLDFAGKPMASRQVELLGLVEVVRNRTDADGIVRLDVDASLLGPGEMPLTVRFSDPVLGEATRSVSVTVTSQTRLSVHVGTLLRGETANLTGRLVDALGGPLVRQAVDVRLGPFTTRAVTDARGDWRASFPIGESPRAGRLIVVAAYAGTSDGVYAASANDTTPTLRDAPTLVLGDDSVIATRPTVEGRLVTLVGEPLANRQLRVRTAAGDAPVFTDDRGAFRAFLTLSPGQALGRFDVRFVMEGEELLQALDATVPFLLKDQGILRAELPASASTGASLRVPFTVLDSQGRSVPGVRITLTLDGEPVKAEVVGGAFTFAIPSTVKPGPHTLVARVVSDVVSAPAVTKEFDVRRATSLRLAEQPTPLVPGEPGEIRVRLMSGASPLGNESILVNGAGVPFVVATDEGGVARVPVPEGRVTAATFQIAYLGKGENGASSLVVTMGTAPAPQAGEGLGFWGWLLLALLVLGAAAVAAFVARRRRSPAAEVLRKAARRLRTNRADVRALYDAYLGLLDLAGIDEDAGETLTFGAVLSRFLEAEERSGAEADLALLTEIFNRAVYAPDLLDADSVERGTYALENVARHVRSVVPAAAPAQTA